MRAHGELFFIALAIMHCDYFFILNCKEFFREICFNHSQIFVDLQRSNWVLRKDKNYGKNSNIETAKWLKSRLEKLKHVFDVKISEVKG